MQWSMPYSVRQWVAAGLALVALGAFTLGLMGAPSRGRMPGEKVAGATGAATLQATDAVPLSADRIEGAAARELTPEEKEKLQEAKEAKQEADDAAKAAAATAPPTPAGQVETAPAAAPPPAPSADEAPH